MSWHIRLATFIDKTKPWSTFAAAMVGIYGSAFLIMAFGIGREQVPLAGPVVPPEHFRMIVNRKTVDGFVGTNIDGSRYVTTRFRFDPGVRLTIHRGDTLDTWFNHGEIQLKTHKGLRLPYKQREILNVHY